MNNFVIPYFARKVTDSSHWITILVIASRTFATTVLPLAMIISFVHEYLNNFPSLHVLTVFSNGCGQYWIKLWIPCKNQNAFNRDYYHDDAHGDHNIVRVEDYWSGIKLLFISSQNFSVLRAICQFAIPSFEDHWIQVFFTFQPFVMFVLQNFDGDFAPGQFLFWIFCNNESLSEYENFVR